jgi:hypothetical protein
MISEGKFKRAPRLETINFSQNDIKKGVRKHELGNDGEKTALSV